MFQKYDQEVSEFIDIEEEDENDDNITDKDKLKLVVTPCLQAEVNDESLPRVS